MFEVPRTAGGHPRLVLGVLGALLLGVIGSALVTLRAPAFYQQAIQGALLLLAISIDIIVSRRTAQRLQIEGQHHAPPVTQKGGSA